MFRWNVSGLEALYRDYGDRVTFYYVYKSLAHPGHKGYVRPYDLEERLAHVAEARRTLGMNIPWLVDDMDNGFAAILNHLPNGELLLDPEGRILVKHAWSDVKALRRSLADLLGPVARPTRPKDLELTRIPVKTPTRDLVEPIDLPRNLTPISSQPDRNPKPYYIKLRAEVTPALLRTGEGHLYLKLTPDPLYQAHWNNLAGPLVVELEGGSHVSIENLRLQGPELEVEVDSEPREFLVPVSWNRQEQPLRLTADYYVCQDAEGWCKAVSRGYELHLEKDENAGWRIGRLLEWLISAKDKRQ